ncbi:unnamed protein product [Thlaspi arvense]|uniref:Uncharacterized protein n=1 Tax=Thlaspi arvense TaxID=13288 RepID=A0AAU9S6F4_THLAR|nr:unnamed protein product [Thlaspi arvense]
MSISSSTHFRSSICPSPISATLERRLGAEHSCKQINNKRSSSNFFVFKATKVAYDVPIRLALSLKNITSFLTKSPPCLVIEDVFSLINLQHYFFVVQP